MTQTKRQQRIFTGDWSCACSSGWDGEDCSTRLETNCGDGVDNDGGELFFVFVGGVVRCYHHFQSVLCVSNMRIRDLVVGKCKSALLCAGLLVFPLEPVNNFLPPVGKSADMNFFVTKFAATKSLGKSALSFAC